MAQRGPKRTYSAERLEESVQRCIDFCLDTGEPPENYILRRETGLSDDTVERIRHRADEEMRRAADEGREPDAEVMKCAEIVKKWDSFKTYFWVRAGMNEPKVQSMAIFMLKQPRNGGFTDKPVGAVGNVEVVVKTEGVGGDKAFG